MSSALDLPSGVDYAEMRRHELRKTRMVMVDGNLTADTTLSERGLSVRVLNGGNWGFASLPSDDEVSAQRLRRKAKANVDALSVFSPPSRAYFPDDSYVGDHHVSDVNSLSHKECVDLLGEMQSLCEKRYPKLKSSTFILHEEGHSKELRNSYGSETANSISRCGCHVLFIADDANGEPIDIRQSLSGKGGLADLGLGLDACEATFDELYEHLLAKRHAVAPRGGEHTVVLAPEVSGILAHEAMGHPCEADIVLCSAVMRNRVGEKIASDLVTMIDFAHTYEGRELQIPVYVDDEGTEAKDTVLIKDGILKDFMTSRETAAKLEIPSTGNARAYRPNDEPLVRMRNTAILPGTGSLPDMISEVDDGYYLVKTGNGEADSTTEFMFSVGIAYEIKNGKLGNAVTNTTLSGTAINMLQTVDAVSSDMHWECGGYCGKKQLMVVSMGGPALRAKAHLGGK